MPNTRGVQGKKKNYTKGNRVRSEEISSLLWIGWPESASDIPADRLVTNKTSPANEGGQSGQDRGSPEVPRQGRSWSILRYLSILLFMTTWKRSLHLMNKSKDGEN